MRGGKSVNSSAGDCKSPLSRSGGASPSRPTILRRLFRVFYREPDFIIGGAENPYIRRWWVIPRNPIFNIYLHNQVRDDDDRALHDHPWCNMSIIIKGGYREWRPRWAGGYYAGQVDHEEVGTECRAPIIIFRRATTEHRLELLRDRFTGEPIPSWSIFITGPKLRDWGFWCFNTGKARWVHWQKFTDPSDTGKVGKGCDA